MALLFFSASFWYNSPGLGPVGVSDHEQCAFEILTLTIFIDLRPFQFFELFWIFFAIEANSSKNSSSSQTSARPQPDLSSI